LRIGILTFHCADNYGAVLQTAALYHTLRGLFPAHETGVVDYRPEDITRVYRVLRPTGPRSLVYSVLQLPFSIPRKARFNQFRKKHLRMIAVNDLGAADCLVCGSDQIWNPGITNGLDPCYFGLMKGFSGAAVSYAASDGGALGNAGDRELDACLSRLSAISVREASMLPVLEKHHKSAVVTVDPVLLPGADYWRSLAGGKKHKNYVLIYTMENNDALVEDACRLARSRNLETIRISYGYPLRKMFQNRYKTVAAAGPREFVSLFCHADVVMTNSFHGTAFAIVFGKEFYAYKLSGANGRRIEDLLRTLGLSHRCISSLPAAGTVAAIDYGDVERKLSGERQRAIEYITHALTSPSPPPPNEIGRRECARRGDRFIARLREAA
jgi:hypothetical protein